MKNSKNDAKIQKLNYKMKKNVFEERFSEAKKNSMKMRQKEFNKNFEKL